MLLYVAEVSILLVNMELYELKFLMNFLEFDISLGGTN